MMEIVANLSLDTGGHKGKHVICINAQFQYF